MNVFETKSTEFEIRFLNCSLETYLSSFPVNSMTYTISDTMKEVNF